MAVQFTGELPKPDGRLDFPPGEVHADPITGRPTVVVSDRAYPWKETLEVGDWVVTDREGGKVLVLNDATFRREYTQLKAGKSVALVSGVWLRASDGGKVQVLVEVEGEWRLVIEDQKVQYEDGLPFVCSHIAEARGFADKPLDPITTRSKESS